MNKSLAPLIISFAVIILLTFIIINTKPRESAIELQTNGTAPTMSLSPASKTQFKHKAPLTRKQKDSYIPDSEKFLEDAKIIHYFRQFKPWNFLEVFELSQYNMLHIKAFQQWYNGYVGMLKYTHLQNAIHLFQENDKTGS